jgi:hypothetical protein
MRRIDKKLNMMKANLLAETRHLESKGLISENNAERSSAELSNERLARLGINPYTGEKSISGTQKTNPDIIALAKDINNSAVGNIKKQKELIKKVSEENKFDKKTEYNLIIAVEKIRKKITSLEEGETPVIENNNEMDLEENPKKLNDIIRQIRVIVNPYIDIHIGAAIANHNWEAILTAFNQSLSRNSKYKDEFAKEYSKLAENSLYENRLFEEDDLSNHKGEMSKTGDYPWVRNAGNNREADRQEAVNKNAKENFEKIFNNTYMGQAIETTNGLYTFKSIKYNNNHGNYDLMFTKPKGENDFMDKTLWITYSSTDGYYITNKQGEVQLTDDKSKEKVTKMLSYNK